LFSLNDEHPALSGLTRPKARHADNHQPFRSTQCDPTTLSCPVHRPDTLIAQGDNSSTGRPGVTIEYACHSATTKRKSQMITWLSRESGPILTSGNSWRLVLFDPRITDAGDLTPETDRRPR